MLVHRDNNFVQSFDTGFEAHGDHVDVKGTPKWGALEADSKQPTHFKAKGNEILIFNDDDATLDIMQCKVDYAGNWLIVLLHNGEVQLYDLKTNTLVKSGNILPATDKAETQKPQLAATSKYLYLTQPKTGEVLQVEMANLSNAKKIKVSGTPYSLAIVGIESSEDLSRHDHFCRVTAAYYLLSRLQP